MNKDTIVALATPPGLSALGVIRISGNAVPEVCKKIFPKAKFTPRLSVLATAINTQSNAVIDKFITVYFPAPNSYTGEDVLELFPHGNPFIIRKLLEAILLIEGIRLAERGEFTQRAFLNGKMDLIQAESVGEILNAKSSWALQNSQKLLAGNVSDEINELAESLRKFSAHLELETDFVEDISADNNYGSNNVLTYELNGILQKLSAMRSRCRKPQNSLPHIVLFGAPNAGKSSLINALANENRLLVSEIPGTTRDFIEVPLQLSSGDVLLIDTAGFSLSIQNELDKLAMQKSETALETADLRILVIDASAPLPVEFDAWRKTANLIVYTHIDINKNIPNISNGDSNIPICNVSSKTGEGISELKTLLQNLLFPPEQENEEPWIDNERQATCIKNAEECANRALDLFKQKQVPIEIIAFEMRAARNFLQSVIGEITDESVLNAIFDKYCIGK